MLIFFSYSENFLTGMNYLSMFSVHQSKEYSYIGLGELFLSGKFFTLKFDFSQFDSWFIFQINSFCLLKERQNPLSQSSIIKVVKSVKEIRF